MKVSIEKTPSGVVQFLYGEDEIPSPIANPTNVMIKEVAVPVGRPVVKQPAIQFSFQDGRGSQTVLYTDLVNINGTAKPADINDAILLLGSEVFSTGGDSGEGAVNSVTGDLVSGTPSDPIIDMPEWVNEQLALRANIAATQLSSAALTFTTDSISGTVAAPITGNITGNITGAILGVTLLVIHNSGVAPTFDSKFKKLSGSGDYVISQVNYIYCQYINATTILYAINQAV